MEQVWDWRPCSASYGNTAAIYVFHPSPAKLSLLSAFRSACRVLTPSVFLSQSSASSRIRVSFRIRALRAGRRAHSGGSALLIMGALVGDRYYSFWLSLLSG